MKLFTYEVKEDPGRGFVAFLYRSGGLWRHSRFVKREEAERWCKGQCRKLNRDFK